MARRPTATYRAGPDEQEAQDLEAAWLEIEPVTARRLMVAGVMAFATKGYHATTTRDITERVGLSPGALYVHFPSKEELLYRISQVGTRQSLEAVQSALSAAAAEPMARLQAVIRAQTVRSARYHTTGRVVEYELGSLAEDHRAEIARMRREIDGMVREILHEGVAQGVFEVTDVPGTTVALLSLTVDVARWYNASGRRSPEEIGDLYAELAGRMVRRASATRA